MIIMKKLNSLVHLSTFIQGVLNQSWKVKLIFLFRNLNEIEGNFLQIVNGPPMPF